MDIRIDPALKEEMQLKHSSTYMDTHALIFEFIGKPNIAIYGDKYLLIIKRDVIVLRAMINPKKGSISIDIGDNSFVHINAPIINIFKDTHGEICFFPIQEDEQPILSIESINNKECDEEK